MGEHDRSRDTAARTRSLADERRELEAHLTRIEGSARAASGGISFGKRVGEGTSLAVERITEVAVHNRLQEQLAAVKRAQQHLENGGSDECENCGGPIDPARVKAVPSAVTCIDCAEAPPPTQAVFSP